MSPNHLLAAVLDDAGMSRAGLAQRVNDLGARAGLALRYDHTSVGRWLKGQRPRGRSIELVCAVLSERLGREITPQDIDLDTHTDGSSGTSLPAFVERAPALWTSDHRNATTALETPAVTGMAAIAPVWEWENPPHDLDASHRGSVRVGTEDLEMLRGARTHYERMYQQAGGLAAKPRVTRFLAEAVTPVVRGSYPDHIGRPLFRAAGGLVAIAGICSYDCDQQGLAQRYFHQALRMAKASGDHAFGGYVIALLVNQAMHMRDYRQVIAFAEAGIRTAGPHLSPALATDLYAMQAKAFARMKQSTAARSSLGRAEDANVRIRRTEEPPETGYVQPGRVEAQAAEALLSLGDHRPAMRYAKEAVGTQTHARGKVHRLATLTSLAIACRDLDQAVVAADATLDAAQGMESRRLTDRLYGVHRELAHHTDVKAVREVAEKVETVLSMPI
ncbi:transcriptional regulator [Streptomyces sp. SID3343]|uniref:transcriptional regulator n=1 Tax=Streptomyces sp. SID3343 TaxID=2690260 RepID=UPI00136E8DE2|nr:transcriptional regulator [Streptomyces sp. SID3343]MYW06017.1 transcriptional regulator [Streptomyces sp. SID3343]